MYWYNVIQFGDWEVIVHAENQLDALQQVMNKGFTFINNRNITITCLENVKVITNGN